MTRIGYEGWLQVNLTAKDRGNIKRPLTFTASHNSIQDLSFSHAADYTAKLVASKYDNIHLLLSGGLDSEFVAKTLVKNNIPFTPVMFVFDNNSSESWYAYKFCDEHQLTPIVYDFKGAERADEFMELALKASLKMNMPPIPSVWSVLLADMLPDAHVLNGFGEVFRTSTEYYNESHDKVLDLSFNQHYVEMAYGDKHPGAFFTYTPELMLSSIKEFDSSINSQVAKAKLYGIESRSKIDTAEYAECCSQQKRDYWRKIIFQYALLTGPENYMYCTKTKQEWLEFLDV